MTDRYKTQGAAVILVDAAGRLLLHLRDDKEGIPLPGMWSIPGGAIEAGESSLAAARRELLEETGQQVERLYPLALVPEGPAHVVHIFCGGATFRQEAIVIGEGQEFRFIPPPEIDALKPLSPFAAPVLRSFITNPLYQRCIEDARGR